MQEPGILLNYCCRESSKSPNMVSELVRLDLKTLQDRPLVLRSPLTRLNPCRIYHTTRRKSKHYSASGSGFLTCFTVVRVLWVIIPVSPLLHSQLALTSTFAVVNSEGRTVRIRLILRELCCDSDTSRCRNWRSWEFALPSDGNIRI